MMFFYNIAVLLYAFAIHLAAPFKTKAKQWVQGRKNWRDSLSQKLAAHKNKKKLWIHCASLGEFEQGRPIIEHIKKNYPDYCIVLSFFSPSGYEVRKNYDSADVICYMPLDTKRNAEDFLELVDPSVVLFIKYEFWINFLNTLKAKNINAYLVSAVFKDHHPFFKWYGGIFIKSLEAFKILFVQDEHSLQLLNSIGIKNAMVCGDTRFDRVTEIRNKFTPLPDIEKFKGDRKLIIAGSTWPKDEDIVLEAYQKLDDKNVKLIIVPHDIEPGLLKATESKIEKAGLSYSLYTNGINNDSNVLVLNTMGMLSRLYYYSDVTYIGGGFNGGLHNCLEPAVFRKPVTFYKAGHKKYNEAVELISIGAAKGILESKELKDAWKEFLFDQNKILKAKEALDIYFERNARNTEKVLAQVKL